MFGYVGAEQKEGWFYVTDNKQPKIKIKIKILGNGELTKKFTVKVPCSASAKAKIEKAGGSVA